MAVESEAQMADLLAAEADRGDDQLSAEAARAGKAEARWERKYAALKEGVGELGHLGGSTLLSHWLT